MSNYPPTPSFGGPFNFGAHWLPPPPPPSNGQPSLPRNQIRLPDAQAHQQLQQHHLTGAPAPFLPFSPQDLQTLYTANASSFTANAQAREYLREGHSIHPPPPPVFPYPPPFAAASLPPPPFPPVPIPIPHLPSQNHQSEAPTTQNQISSSTRHTDSVTQPEQPLVETKVAAIVSVAEPSTEEDIDREEGELSEEEFGVGVETKEDDSPISGRVSPAMGDTWSMIAGNKNVESPVTDHHGQDQINFTNTLLKPNIRLDRNNLNLTSQDHHPASEDPVANGRVNGLNHPHNLFKPTYDRSPQSFVPAPPSKMQNLQQPSLSFTDFASRESISTENQGLSGSQEQYSITANPAQLKKQATGALINLLPHNIRYDDLVREGVDPVVLRSLYDEIGVRIATSSPPFGSNLEQTSAPVLESTESVPSQAKPEPMVETTNSGIPTTPHQNLKVPQESTTKSQGALELVSQPEIQAAKASSTISPVGASVMPASKVSDNKPEESRSEYLARLLATKTGKAAASTGHSDSSAVAPKPTLPDQQLTQTQTQSAKESGAPKATGETRSKEKSKAQTELARQKMEQLRQQVLQSKAASQHHSVDGSGASALRASVPPSLFQTHQQPSPAILPSRSQDSPSAVGAISSETPVSPPHQNQFSGTPDSDRRAISQIPGLFMTEPQQSALAGPSTVPVLAQARMEAARGPSSRKRPVASDFMDEALLAPKRPFGQTRASQVVIDISDDEIDYGKGSSDMDIDEPVSADDSDIPLKPNETAKQQALRNLPPLTDFPGRQPFSVPSNPMTPPVASAPQTPGKGKELDDLRRKDQQIEEMKRKIKEMELRRKVKQQTSRTQTPSTPSVQAAIAESSTQPELQSADTVATVPLTQDPVIEAYTLPSDPGKSVRERAEAQTAVPGLPLSTYHSPPTQPKHREVEPMRLSSSPAPQLDPLKARELELKRKRKAELESGLPMLDAEVERTRSKLDEMRKEMLKMEEEIARGLEGRRLLVQELEALGIDTDGVPTDELQAKMDQIVDQQNLAESNMVPSSGDPEPAERSPVLRELSPQIDNISLCNPSSMEVSNPSEAERSISEANDQEALDSSDHLLSPEQQPEVILVSSSSNSGAEDGELDSNGVSLRHEQQDDPDTYSDGDDSAMSLDESAQGDSPGSDMEAVRGQMEYSETPDPVQPPPLELVDERDISRQNSSPQSSVEPVEAKDTEATDSGHEPDVSESLRESEDDFYEPPEPVSIVVADETNYSPPFSPAPPDTSLSEPAISSSSFGPQPFEDAHTDPPRASSSFEPSRAVLPSQVSNQFGRYTPYESPLRNFHSFRFHTDYASNVQGGYASLTYSNSIDPKNPLCQYESAGGVCNDPSCESQHFRQMQMSDDMILVQLGSIREGTTPEGQKQYLDGLKKVIADMRRDKIKNLNTVAEEIAKYRRQFLQDPSRVLAL